MKKQEFYVNSTDEIHKLHCISWESESVEQVAVLQLVHGMAEHIERYDEFANYLANLGVVVVGHDHLGHGKSVNNEKELGFFHNEKGGKYIIQDIHKVRKNIQKKYTNLPHYILGHSMGSFCVRNYLCVYGEGIEGAIIMGTGFIPVPLVTSARTFLRSLERVNGGTYRSNKVEKEIFRDFNRGIENKITHKDWLTRDEEIVTKFIDDPLCDFMFTLRAYDDFLSILGYVGKSKYMKTIPKDIRVLVTSGDKDPVGNWGKAPGKIAEQFIEYKFQDVTLKMYTDARHEILNELNRLEVYKDISGWLLKKM